MENLKGVNWKEKRQNLWTFLSFIHTTVRTAHPYDEILFPVSKKLPESTQVGQQRIILLKKVKTFIIILFILIINTLLLLLVNSVFSLKTNFRMRMEAMPQEWSKNLTSGLKDKNHVSSKQRFRIFSLFDYKDKLFLRKFLVF